MDARAIKELNDWAVFSTYKPTWISQKFLNCPYRILCLFTGNQFGKGALVILSIILRLIGFHPVPRKNGLYYECKNKHAYAPYQILNMNLGTSPYDGAIVHERYKCQVEGCGEQLEPFIRQGSHRIIRFASQSLPASEGTSRAKKNKQDRGAVGEVKNTQYIELMKWMPPYLLQDKAISTRDSTLRIKDVFGINDWIIEFMSFAQLTQVGAGHQRWVSWLDELASENFLQEQIPRLIATKGDLIMSYTVTKEVNYLYDMMFSRATKIYRTKSVCDFFKNKKGVILPREEDVETPYKSRIAVFHASTYDNPTLDKDDIDEIMSLLYSDFYSEDVMNMRLYCVWAELTNLIFPNFNPRTHMVDPKQYFENGELPGNYLRFRSIDYHESVPWAVLFYAISPYNEAFVWAEYTPDPKNNTTLIIAKEIAKISGQYKYNLDLIDPLAAKIQVNTSRTVIDDLNEYFYTFKNENICEGAYFQSADTKNTRGRDKIRERLFNASLCKTPFNNEVKKDGITTYLPTLWVFKDCRVMGLSLQRWREEKGKVIQEFSHYCTALEFLEKDARVKAPPLYMEHQKERKKVLYFQRAR